jgi:hypothetical protein
MSLLQINPISQHSLGISPIWILLISEEMKKLQHTQVSDSSQDSFRIFLYHSAFTCSILSNLIRILYVQS